MLNRAVDDAEAGRSRRDRVVPGVEDQGLERSVRDRLSAAGISLTIASRTSSTPMPVLALMQNGFVRVETDDVLDLFLDSLGLGTGQIDLVDDRNEFQVVFDREIRLASVCASTPCDASTTSSAPSQAESDARPRRKNRRGRAYRSDSDVLLAVLRLVIEPDRVRLDRDAAFALEVHVVEHLRLHIAVGDRARHLQQAVGQRRFAVIDVGDDREVAD